MTAIRNDSGETKGDKTRRRILDAAASEFRHNGYAATSLKVIADRVGVRVASLYHHFPSKESLVEEILAIGRDRTESATRDAVTSMGVTASPIARIRSAIAAHVSSNLNSGDYAVATLRILGQVPEAVRKRQVEGQKAYAKFWSDLLDEGRAAGEIRSDLNPKLVRMLLFGAMNWAVEWYRPDGNSAAEIAAVASEMILSGLHTSGREPVGQGSRAARGRSAARKVLPRKQER
ncbi:MAG TPA: TetR/AcrR family transcriptional regulator [Ramlibacter sp.]|nr:TetR/AcrR family transcriptional regulator [Ramlibacter sp.]